MKNLNAPEYQPLQKQLDALLQQKSLVVLAIDGMCGSGKSTLAKQLAEKYGASVVHLDDFFLPLPMRTPERLNEPGGNLHYERFMTDVLLPLRESETISYRPFLCAQKKLAEQPIVLPKTPLLILEGSYSMRPEFRAFYDCSVFLKITPEEQERRLFSRDPEKMDAFRTRWIPLENRYFQLLKPEEACDFSIQNQ